MDTRTFAGQPDWNKEARLLSFAETPKQEPNPAPVPEGMEDVNVRKEDQRLSQYFFKYDRIYDRMQSRLQEYKGEANKLKDLIVNPDDAHNAMDASYEKYNQEIHSYIDETTQIYKKVEGASFAKLTDIEKRYKVVEDHIAHMEKVLAQRGAGVDKPYLERVTQERSDTMLANGFVASVDIHKLKNNSKDLEVKPDSFVVRLPSNVMMNFGKLPKGSMEAAGNQSNGVQYIRFNEAAAAQLDKMTIEGLVYDGQVDWKAAEQKGATGRLIRAEVSRDAEEHGNLVFRFSEAEQKPAELPKEEEKKEDVKPKEKQEENPEQLLEQSLAELRQHLEFGHGDTGPEATAAINRVNEAFRKIREVDQEGVMARLGLKKGIKVNDSNNNVNYAIVFDVTKGEVVVKTLKTRKEKKPETKESDDRANLKRVIRDLRANIEKGEGGTFELVAFMNGELLKNLGTDLPKEGWMTKMEGPEGKFTLKFENGKFVLEKTNASKLKARTSAEKNDAEYREMVKVTDAALAKFKEKKENGTLRLADVNKTEAAILAELGELGARREGSPSLRTKELTQELEAVRTERNKLEYADKSGKETDARYREMVKVTDAALENFKEKQANGMLTLKDVKNTEAAILAELGELGARREGSPSLRTKELTKDLEDVRTERNKMEDADKSGKEKEARYQEMKKATDAALAKFKEKQSNGTLRLEDVKKTETALLAELGELNARGDGDPNSASIRYRDLTKELDGVRTERNKMEDADKAAKEKEARYQEMKKATDAALAKFKEKQANGTLRLEDVKKTETALLAELGELNARGDGDPNSASIRYRDLTKELDGVRAERNKMENANKPADALEGAKKKTDEALDKVKEAEALGETEGFEKHAQSIIKAIDNYLNVAQEERTGRAVRRTPEDDKRVQELSDEMNRQTNRKETLKAMLNKPADALEEAKKKTDEALEKVKAAEALGETEGFSKHAQAIINAIQKYLEVAQVERTGRTMQRSPENDKRVQELSDEMNRQTTRMESLRQVVFENMVEEFKKIIDLLRAAANGALKLGEKPADKAKEQADGLRAEIGVLELKKAGLEKEWNDTIKNGYEGLHKDNDTGFKKLDQLSIDLKKVDDEIKAKKDELKALESKEKAHEDIDALITERTKLNGELQNAKPGDTDVVKKVKLQIEDIDTKLKDIRTKLDTELKAVKPGDADASKAIKAKIEKINAAIGEKAPDAPEKTDEERTKAFNDALKANGIIGVEATVKGTDVSLKMTTPGQSDRLLSLLKIIDFIPGISHAENGTADNTIKLVARDAKAFDNPTTILFILAHAINISNVSKGFEDILKKLRGKK